MRILLDTNVLIAALIARGVCHQLLEHCVRNHELVTSEFILNELREKLVEKFNYSAQVADEVIGLLRSRMEVALATVLDAPVCRDPDDDNVLAAALAGDCAAIVTGDNDLLVLKEFPTDRDHYTQDLPHKRVVITAHRLPLVVAPSPFAPSPIPPVSPIRFVPASCLLLLPPAPASCSFLITHHSLLITAFPAHCPLSFLCSMLFFPLK